MGIIQAGILSPVSGKVSGVVGGRWKDKAYLRGYVKPANPNTVAQQAQRAQFARCVNFAKPLVGQVFNAYTDKFIKSMSGFNFFIRRNIEHFTDPPEYSDLVLTEGPLSPISGFNAGKDGTVLRLSWATNYGNNGSHDDQMFAACVDKSTGIWYFAAEEQNRSTIPLEIEVPGSLTYSNLECYLWANKYVGTVLDIISNSLHDTASDYS